MTSAVTVRLSSVVIGGPADAWAALGFTVDATGQIAFSNGAIELETGAVGAVALRVDGIEALPADVEGVALRPGPRAHGVDHANGCFELDHVVIVTPSIERTSAAITEVLGLPQRRVRQTESVKQAFHRFDERGCIIELVESAKAERPALWGLVVTTTDLDGFVERAGPALVTAPKPAVQPGRRIATVRGSAGLALPVAVMSA